ncbi:PepSY-associated TM helix domain-containing protein [Novosphingobium album (ex Hu et al. 2023)]|uniref:PepSY-associated TM helix domain-containing protein n=1 Tax=Novosphingobium album (ex Hu et al. 2023) TaxID=2930093 RepID=A0ABT0B0I7_9SPHN|nr:PepSY-associated TM helix domain-containing protein [Novosphingobium album (ex Hu et al. 2023)]MCJ2178304.1 PepSY-associated TM helix domain-containing protein [Novosphingobium album (ex Hu et al. 2023)]
MPAAGATQRRQPRKSRKARSFWLKQLHAWHWMSAAISLAGMLLFAITGITLNHASSISARPVGAESRGVLSASLLANLPAPNDGHAELPADVAKAVAAAVPVDPAGRAADWTDEEEVYVALPGPGRDAWVSIDRASGEITAETTSRGWISYLNDLHKGRNTGAAWFWFIDLFAAACVIFTLTGLFLLQLHARHRPSTWPLVGFSLVLPVVLALFFIH